MNKKYIISALITGALCLLPLNSNNTTTFRRPEKSYAAGRSLYSGLIEKCALKCSGQDGIIRITAKTQSSGKMRKIGFTDMTIQRSSDQSSWSTEKDLGDLLGANVRFYTLDNYTETVDGGYYYRVVCDHYAEGIPVSGDSAQIQETPNASRDVWIDPDPDAVVTTTTEPVTTTRTTRKTTTTTKPVTATKPVTTVVRPVQTNIAQPQNVENDNSTDAVTTTSTRAQFGPISYSPKNGMSSHNSNANKGGESTVISGGGQKTSRNSSSSDSKDKSGKSGSSDSNTSSPKTGAVPPTAASLAALSAAAAACVLRRRKK